MPMKNPSHPGEIVRDICIDGLKLTVTEGAKALGVARTTLSRLLNGRSSLSSEMAVRLSKAFGSTAGFWLRLQLNYDLVNVAGKIKKIRVHCVGPEKKSFVKDNSQFV